jgi:hypothetical protein
MESLNRFSEIRNKNANVLRNATVRGNVVSARRSALAYGI